MEDPDDPVTAPFDVREQADITLASGRVVLTDFVEQLGGYFSVIGGFESADDLAPDERIELANVMIRRWTKFGFGR
jgi:hypothetical protein